MKTPCTTSILCLVFLCVSARSIHAQEFTCRNSNYDFLKRAIGSWSTQTRDRVAVGEYEANEGAATIESSIQGCSIQISFSGTFRGKPYARETIIAGLDSVRIQMVSMDSEHGGFLTYEGQIKNETLEVKWFRNKEKGKLQSKYIMHFKSDQAFNFSSFLSTDYGKTWDLTHERIFSRKSSND